MSEDVKILDESLQVPAEVLEDLQTGPDLARKSQIAEKIGKALEAIKPLPKKGRHDKYDYAFFESDDVLGEARRVLGEVGIAFSFSLAAEREILRTRKGSKDPNRVYQGFYIMALSDTETGQTLRTLQKGESFVSGDAAPQKAATSAIKSFLLRTLLMSSGETSGASSSSGTGRSGSRRTGPGSTPGPGTGAPDPEEIREFAARLSRYTGHKSPEDLLEKYLEYFGKDEIARFAIEERKRTLRELKKKTSEIEETYTKNALEVLPEEWLKKSLWWGSFEGDTVRQVLESDKQNGGIQYFGWCLENFDDSYEEALDLCETVLAAGGGNAERVHETLEETEETAKELEKLEDDPLDELEIGDPDEDIPL